MSVLSLSTMFVQCKGPFTQSISANAARMLAILFSLKTVGLLENSLQTHSAATLLLPAATKLGQGNKFTGMCLSTTTGCTWSGPRAGGYLVRFQGGVPGLVPGVME